MNETKHKVNSRSWKNRLSEMKEGDEISASLRWSANTFTLQKRLNKFRKLGYLKYLGCKANHAVYIRTNQPINNKHF